MKLWYGTKLWVICVCLCFDSDSHSKGCYWLACWRPNVTVCRGTEHAAHEQPKWILLSRHIVRNVRQTLVRLVFLILLLLFVRDRPTNSLLIFML